MSDEEPKVEPEDEVPATDEESVDETPDETPAE